MDWHEYSDKALRTANYKLSTAEQIAACGLGLLGESGEIADSYKKRLYHGRNDQDTLAEVGDLYWYIAQGEHFLGSLGAFGAEAKAGVTMLEVPSHDPFEHSGLKSDAIAYPRRVAGLCAELSYQAASFTMAVSHGEKLRTLYKIAGCAKALCIIEGTEPYKVLESNIAKLEARWPLGFKVGA